MIRLLSGSPGSVSSVLCIHSGHSVHADERTSWRHPGRGAAPGQSWVRMIHVRPQIMASASCNPAKQPLPGRPQAPYLSPHPQALPPPVVTTLRGLSPAPALSLDLSFPLGTWKDGPGSSQGYFWDPTFHGLLPSPLSLTPCPHCPLLVEFGTDISDGKSVPTGSCSPGA